MLFLVLLLFMGTYSSQDIILTGGKSITVFSGRGRSNRLESKGGFSLERNPPGTWPWAVSIGENQDGEWFHVCDGVIISGTHVITSAGCINDFEDPNYGAGRSVETLSIRAGDSHLKFDREDVQEIRISGHKKHPKYDTWGWEHYKDVAVIFLSSELDFSTKFVRPAYLPTLEEALQTTKSMDTDIALAICGWGGTISGKGGNLEDAVITSFSDGYCNLVYRGNGLSKNFTDDILCGGSILDLSGTCSAGRGSGIFQLNHSKKRFVLTGILSSDSDSCGSHITPNVLVRVASRSIITFLYKTIYNIDSIYVAPLKPLVEPKQDASLGPYYEICGTNNVLDIILGSNNTNKNMLGRWPWLVPLFADIRIPGESVFFCGATILTETKLLTAAHCVDAFNKKLRMKVRAGDVQLQNSNDDSMVQEVLVSDVTLHSKYKFNRYFDLAIIHLKSPMKFTSRIKPVCLLSLEEAAEITKYDEISLSLAVCGWGKNSNGIAGETLKQNVASVFSKAICDKTHEDVQNMRNLVPDLFTEDVLCAGDPAGASGTCNGDSGGGAVHFDQEKQRYILRAVVSGSKLGECGAWFAPNIYTRLANNEIMDWIYNQIAFEAPRSVRFDDGNIKIHPGHEVVFTCTAEANPAPQILWKLSDDDKNVLLFKESSYSYQVGDLWITKSKLHFVVPTKGNFVNVHCTGRNLVGRTTIKKVLDMGNNKYFNSKYQHIRNLLAPTNVKIEIKSNKMDNLHGKGEIERSPKKSTGKAMLYLPNLRWQFREFQLTHAEYTREDMNIDLTLRIKKNHGLNLKSNIEHCSHYDIVLKDTRTSRSLIELKHNIDCNTYVGGLKYKILFFGLDIWQSPIEKRVTIKLDLLWKHVGLDVKVTTRQNGITIYFDISEDGSSYTTKVTYKITDTNFWAGKNKMEFLLTNVRLGYWPAHDRKGLLQYDQEYGNVKIWVSCGPYSGGMKKNFSLEFNELTKASGSAALIGCNDQVIGANYQHIDRNVNFTLNLFSAKIFLMSDIKTCSYSNYLVRLSDSSEIRLNHKIDCNSLEIKIKYATPFDFFKKLLFEVSKKKHMIQIGFDGFGGKSEFEGKISQDMRHMTVKFNGFRKKILLDVKLTQDNHEITAKLTGLGKTVLLDGKMRPDKNGVEIKLNLLGWKIIELKLSRMPRINGDTVDAKVIFDGKTYSAVIDITKEPDLTFKVYVLVNFNGKTYNAKMEYNPHKEDNSGKKISYSVKFDNVVLKGDYEHNTATPNYVLKVALAVNGYSYECDLEYDPIEKQVKIKMTGGGNKFQGKLSMVRHLIEMKFKGLRKIIKFIGKVLPDKNGIKIEFEELGHKQIELELKNTPKYNGKDYIIILNVDGETITAGFNYSLIGSTYTFNFKFNLNNKADIECKISYNLKNQIAKIKLSASSFIGKEIMVVLDLKARKLQLIG